jgi:homoaconitate hydratase
VPYLKSNPFILGNFRFKSIGATSVYDSSQIVFTLDHNVQDFSSGNLKKYREIEEFSKNQKIDFYPAGSGIGHQIMIEQGYGMYWYTLI